MHVLEARDYQCRISVGASRTVDYNGGRAQRWAQEL